MAAKEYPDPSLNPSLDQHKESHPVGVGVGAAGGALAGAAVGSTAGPAGTVVGGVIGAVAGGLAGRGVAGMVHPEPDLTPGQAVERVLDHDREHAHWREAHMAEPYYNPAYTYEDYAPAYRMGWESRAKYDGGTFEQYEPAFRNDWDSAKGESRLGWDEARHAVRAGWHRIERALHGDADRDGR